MENSEKEKRKKEIIKNGELSGTGYESIISQIIDKIYEVGFCFSCDYNSPKPSRIEWTEKRVRLRIIPHKKPIHYIWDLLHEYGHFLSGEPPRDFDPIKELDREIEAWDNALKEMKNSYSNMLTEIEDFKFYREHSLINYRKKHDRIKRERGLL